MAIEESKIIDLIAIYKGYEEKYWQDLHRASICRSVIEDLESLLPRKSIAGLDVDDYDELTGTIIEYGGRRGVLLEGEGETVTLFIFASKALVYSSPDVVYPLDEDRLWNEGGVIL